jgi:hypothetical protein
MAVININIGKDDVLNINVAGTQQASDGKEVIDALYEKLYSALNEYNHKRYEEEHKSWWYEAFIDFGEDFDEFIYPKIKSMDYEEQFTFCLGYMWRRDNYYFGPEHYDALNEMVRNIKEEEFK